MLAEDIVAQLAALVAERQLRLHTLGAGIVLEACDLDIQKAAGRRPSGSAPLAAVLRPQPVRPILKPLFSTSSASSGAKPGQRMNIHRQRRELSPSAPPSPAPLDVGAVAPDVEAVDLEPALASRMRPGPSRSPVRPSIFR